MTGLMRWAPYRDSLSIRELMDRFFNEPMGGLHSLTEGAHVPAVDLYQTEDEVVVKALLPGMKAEDIAISVTGEALTLRGIVAEESERSDATYYLRERRQGEFSRTLPLPATVVADKAKAEFENGVLTLTLPKAEEVKPKTITVKAK